MQGSLFTSLGSARFKLSGFSFLVALLVDTVLFSILMEIGQKQVPDSIYLTLCIFIKKSQFFHVLHSKSDCNGTRTHNHLVRKRSLRTT